MPKGIGYKKSTSEAKKHNPGNPKKKSGQPGKTTTTSPEKAKTMLRENSSKSKSYAGKGAKKK